MLGLVDEREAERADKDTGAQVAEHGTEAKALADRHTDNCRKQIDDGFVQNCHAAIPGQYAKSAV